MGICGSEWLHIDQGATRISDGNATSGPERVETVAIARPPVLVSHWLSWISGDFRCANVGS